MCILGIMSFYASTLIKYGAANLCDFYLMSSLPSSTQHNTSSTEYLTRILFIQCTVLTATTFLPG